MFEIAKTASGYASAATILYSFCAQTNCADGSIPVAGLIADADGNLFGTTEFGGANTLAARCLRSPRPRAAMPVL